MSTTFHSPNSASEASRESGTNGTVGLQAELTTVRSLEASIAERLAAARDSREVVLTAARAAEAILDEARAKAAQAAQAAQAAIHADALRDAGRLRRVAEERCAAITANAAARREHDVAALLAGVLPAAASPSPARADGPWQVRGQEATW